MQIPVEVNRDGITEWVIVELQGSLLADKAEDTAGCMPDISGKLIGDLVFTKDGTPVLIVGHQCLFGKDVPLEKTFAVLVKNNAPEKDAYNSQIDSQITTEAPLNKSEVEVSYQVKALIRRKLIFKQRPKPIVTSLPKK